MSRFLDTWMPWLADLLELGGPILTLILVLALFIWVLLFERFYFLQLIYPHELRDARRSWWQRPERTSWYAQQHRDDLVATLANALTSNYSLIGTLIKVCPLLGLLGTVMGMLEVFDAMAATGSNNARSMAAGISKATVTTLAGMVVAIVALLANLFVERRATAEAERLGSYFESIREG